MTENHFDKRAASEIVARFDARPEMLVQILHAFVEEFTWISDESIRYLARELNLSLADIHGVVSYYFDFPTEQSGQHVIKMCQAEACQAMGSRQLLAHAEKSLGVEMHKSNDQVALQPVYCLGNCACSPAVMIDGRTYGRVNTERFDELVATLSRGDQ